MTRESLLSISGLAKSYGDTQAVRDVTFDVQAGELVALLGPNGAGKTTTLSISSGLLIPDSGHVLVGGKDVAKSPSAAKSQIGFAQQEVGLYLTLTGHDNLEYFARLQGLRGRAVQLAISDIVEEMDLATYLDRTPLSLSGGERRRLHVACALVHRPRVMLLDEASTGMDVESRRRLLEIVKRLADGGGSVLYATHYLQEVEVLGGRVVIIDRGQVVADGQVWELTQKFARTSIEVVFDRPVGDLAHRLGHGVGNQSNSMVIDANDPAAAIAEVLSAARSGGIALVEVKSVSPSLETVFSTITGKSFEEDGVL